MPAGRPSLYDPKYCEEIIEYFSVPPYTEKMVKVVSQGNILEVPKEEASDFPSFAGFASKIGVDRFTLRTWCDAHREFSAAYKKAKELQENWMLTNGNKGLVNTAFGIFTAKNVLGYRDRPEEEVVQQQSSEKISIDSETLTKLLEIARGST